MSQRTIQANGRTYKPEEFICEWCHVPLVLDTYYHIEGKNVCQSCRNKERCASCGFLITESKYVTVDNLTYHPDCFRCSECLVELHKFHLENGKLFCSECINLQASTNPEDLCGKCYLPLSGGIIKALGKRYHEDCFVCHSCFGQFPNDEFVNISGNPFCDNCIENKSYLRSTAHLKTTGAPPPSTTSSYASTTTTTYSGGGPSAPSSGSNPSSSNYGSSSGSNDRGIPAGGYGSNTSGSGAGAPGHGSNSSSAGYGSSGAPGYGSSAGGPGYGSSAGGPGYGSSGAPGYGSNAGQSAAPVATRDLNAGDLDSANKKSANDGPGNGSSAGGPGYGSSAGGPGYGSSAGGPGYGSSAGGPGYSSSGAPGSNAGQSAGGPGYGSSAGGPGYGSSAGGPSYGSNTSGAPGYGSRAAPKQATYDDDDDDELDASNLPARSGSSKFDQKTKIKIGGGMKEEKRQRDYKSKAALGFAHESEHLKDLESLGYKTIRVKGAPLPPKN